MTLTDIIKLQKPCEGLEDVFISSLTYNDLQTSEFNVIKNEIKTIKEKSYLFEYNILIKEDLIKYKDSDYLGLLSWKFRFKTGLNKNMLFNLLKEKNYQEYDIINLCPKLPEPYLEFTEQQHKGFRELFDLVCSDLELEVKEPKHTIYSNFFIAKRDTFKAYQELLIKAIELLETKYKDLAWRDSGYKGLSKENLKKYTELEYYTFHTFILERLMSVWIDNEKIKTLDLL